jgi:hypothetical protein
MPKILGVSICVAMLTAAYPLEGVALTQDKLSTIDGMQVVCTGVGSAKSNPRWSSFPVKLVFANRRGEFTAGENVDIRQGDRSVLRTSCDAPWLLLSPAAGHYQVSATLSGQSGVRRASGAFSTSGEGIQRTVTLEFPTASTG